MLILALQIRQSDPEIAQGHVWRTMPEEFHDAGEAYAGAEHESGIGITQLMRDDPSGDSRRSGDFVQRFADLTTFTSLINAQALLSSAQQASPVAPVRPVIEDCHGIKVSDPYR